MKKIQKKIFQNYKKKFFENYNTKDLSNKLEIDKQIKSFCFGFLLTAQTIQNPPPYVNIANKIRKNKTK